MAGSRPALRKLAALDHVSQAAYDSGLVALHVHLDHGDRSLIRLEKAVCRYRADGNRAVAIFRRRALYEMSFSEIALWDQD